MKRGRNEKQIMIRRPTDSKVQRLTKRMFTIKNN